MLTEHIVSTADISMSTLYPDACIRDDNDEARNMLENLLSVY